LGLQPIEGNTLQKCGELENCMVLLLACFEKLFLLDDLFSPDRSALHKVPLSSPVKDGFGHDRL